MCSILVATPSYVYCLPLTIIIVHFTTVMPFSSSGRNTCVKERRYVWVITKSFNVCKKKKLVHALLNASSLCITFHCFSSLISFPVYQHVICSINAFKINKLSLFQREWKSEMSSYVLFLNIKNSKMWRVENIFM